MFVPKYYGGDVLDKKLSKIIKELREKSKTSQQQLADECMCSKY